MTTRPRPHAAAPHMASAARSAPSTRPARTAPMARVAPARQAVGQDVLALERQLCFALYAGSLAMTKAYKPLLEPLGLTYPQYLVMLVLWGQDDLAVGALGERLQLDSGTLTPLLKRLQALGLVQRLRDAEDERRVRIRLTPEGQALRQQARQVPLAMATAFDCSADEIQQLADRLTLLRQRLLAQGGAG